jgi:hypothetical protein
MASFGASRHARRPSRDWEEGEAGILPTSSSLPPASAATAFPGRALWCRLPRWPFPPLPRRLARLLTRLRRYILPFLLLYILLTWPKPPPPPPPPVVPTTPSPITLLSTDFHVGPIGDLKGVALAHPELRLSIVDLSLSGACKHAGTCATPATLKVLRQGDPGHSLYVSDEVRLEFFEAYRDRELPEWEQLEDDRVRREAAVEAAEAAGLPRPPELAQAGEGDAPNKDGAESAKGEGEEAAATTTDDDASDSSSSDAAVAIAALDRSARTLFDRIDAVICSHPTGQCELYMPFNISMIIWATTRFEQGRETDPGKMRGLVTNLRSIASRPNNIIAANNPYDVEYIRYYTGIKPLLIRSVCAYADGRYHWRGYDSGNWQSVTVPVFGYRPGLQPGPIDEFIEPANDIARAQGDPFILKNIFAAYSRRYEYSELAAHPAVVHLPYQVSVMSFYEQYRMGVPIFVPSLELLTRWHMEFLFVSERGWFMKRKLGLSVIERHRSQNDLGRDAAGYHPECRHTDCDPYDDYSYAAVRHWLSLAEYYQYPHVLTFNTWEELIYKLRTTNLRAVSADMRAHAKKVERDTLESWTHVLATVATGKGGRYVPEPWAHPEGVEADFIWRMNNIWGEKRWKIY